MGLEQLFYASVKRYPEKTAIVYQNTRVSYRQVLAGVNAYAEYLEGHTTPGASILILARNSIEQVQLLLGCFAAGRIACPVNWRMSAHDLSGLLKSEDFSLCLYDDACKYLFCEAMELAEKTIRADAITAVSPAQDSSRFYPPQPDERYALQFFTSGSTGEPKRVVHTHESLIHYAQTYSLVSDWGPDEIYETQASLFHMAGFSSMICLFMGGTLILMDRFREEVFFQTMERERCTRVSLVPTLISKCLSTGAFQKYDFSSVKKIVYGGSALPLAQVQRTLSECSCALEQAYGTTETCNVSVLSAEDHRRAIEGELDGIVLQSAGKPIPGVEIRLLDEERRPITDGIGEVAVRSPFLLARLDGPAAENFLDDGFYCTGDIGRMDEKGYLYLLDRKHDMIISGGENIYPREVENCISHMVNDVSMVAVVGVPDDYWGERVVAFVVRHPGSQVTERDIIDFCRGQIAGYKKPRQVIFVDRIPLNSNGKICRKMLKTIYAYDYGDLS